MAEQAMPLIWYLNIIFICALLLLPTSLCRPCSHYISRTISINQFNSSTKTHSLKCVLTRENGTIVL